MSTQTPQPHTELDPTYAVVPDRRLDSPPITKSTPPTEIKIDRKVKNGYLKEYIRARFNELDGEFRTTIPQGGDMECWRMVDEVRQRASTGLSLDDIITYEKAIIKLSPLPYLRRRAWELRSDFRDFAGPSQYDLYLKSNPPNPDQQNVNEAELRFDLLYLQNRLHHLYYLRPARERARNSIVTLIGCSVMAICLITIILVFKLNFDIEAREPAGNKPAMSMFIAPLCAICGAVGGFMSMMRRLQRDSSGGNPLLALYSLVYGRASIFIAPITGAVFSIVLAQLFIAGIITGTVFPKMTTEHDLAYAAIAGNAVVGQTTGVSVRTKAAVPNADAGANNESATLNLHDFLCHTHPVGQTDYATLLIWAFLAGFAEQLVPDSLDRLAAQKKVSENTKEVDTQHT